MKMTKNIKIGIVGTGFVCGWLCEAAEGTEGVEIVAVYSRKRDTGAAFSEKYGISRVYDSYTDMLENGDIDAVYVASPTFLHREHTVKALEYGKHVLCEKAIATTLDEFLEMKDAARRAGKVFLEAMRPAHDPFFDEIISEISALGEITEAHLHFKKYSSRYDKFKEGIVENAFNPDMKNSALSDIGIYPLWLSVRLFGVPSIARAVSYKLSNGFDGSGYANLKYENNDLRVRVSYSKIEESDEPSFVRCEGGCVYIDKISEPKRAEIWREDGTKTVITPTPCQNNMIYELMAFRDMIRGVRDFVPYLEESEALMRAHDLIVKAQNR